MLTETDIVGADDLHVAGGPGHQAWGCVLGDGVAPLTEIFQLLQKIGFNGVLSLELFNPKYWQQDALTVAKTGLQKMKDSVAKALG